MLSEAGQQMEVRERGSRFVEVAVLPEGGPITEADPALALKLRMGMESWESTQWQTKGW